MRRSPIVRADSDTMFGAHSLIFGDVIFGDVFRTRRITAHHVPWRIGDEPGDVLDRLDGEQVLQVVDDAGAGDRVRA